MTTISMLFLLIITAVWFANSYINKKYVACVPIEYRLCINGMSDSDGYIPDAELDYISSEITIRGTQFKMTDYYCTNLGNMHVDHIGNIRNDIVYFDNKATFKIEEKCSDIVCMCSNGKTFVLYKE